MSRFALADELGVESVERAVGHGEAALAVARERAATLDAIVHPGVLAPLEIGIRADGTVVAVMPRIDGDSLGALLTARGALRVGECVTLGIAVADALAAMHRAGIAHGDVSTANIMISTNKITLVDTMAGASATEGGTPGFAAPERPAGATAPGDMYSLGRVLAASVREAERERLAPWVEPMLAAEPGARPSAAMAARALAACATPEAVERPMLGVADSMRARSVASQVVTERRDDARWWRIRRQVRRWGVVAAVVAIVAGVAWVGVPFLWTATHSVPPPGYDPAMPVPANAALPVSLAAGRVTLARFEALVSGDSLALLETTAEGSPARAELEPLAASIAAGDVAVEDLVATVTDVGVVSEAGRRATAIVTYDLSAYVVWDATGEHRYAALTQRIELDLAWSQAGWQVERAREASASP